MQSSEHFKQVPLELGEKPYWQTWHIVLLEQVSQLEGQSKHIFFLFG